MISQAESSGFDNIMGVLEFLKRLKLREWITIGFFIVSLAMLITGIVLIVVVENSIPVFPTFEMPTCPTIGTPKPLFSTSLANGISWNDDLNNPNSDLFKTTSEEIIKNISNAWTSKFSVLAVTIPPVITQINAFSNTQNGVNFYTEFVFLEDSVTTSDVSAVLASQGYPSNTYTTSTSQCSVLNPQSNNQQSTTSNSPATQVTNTPHPQQNGAYCDASSHVLVNIFVVDVSVPIIGTLDNKLSVISSYLRNAPKTINLDQSADWTNQEFRLVVYGGNEPVPLGRARSFNIWNKTIDLLNSTQVNPNNYDAHGMQQALRYVMDNYVPVTGVAVNIIVVTDGFDLSEASSISAITDTLKNKYSYSLGIILMTTSQVMRSVVQPLTSDFFHFYPIDSIEYLNNAAVQNSQAEWACQAFYPTQAPLTPAPTRIPLQTTQTPSTVTVPRTTMNPLLPKITACQQNVLFLIDESQTMLINGYQSAADFAIKMATSLSNLNSLTNFAFITYNSAVISQSSQYTTLTNFISDLHNSPQNVGESDSLIGFNASRSFISSYSQYSDPQTRSLLFFVSDGKNLGNIVSASSIAASLRSLYETQIIGVDLSETQTSQNNIETVINYGLRDGNAQSVYVGVNQPSDITNDQIINSTLYQLTCKDNSNCNIDLTFVIETSEIEGSEYVDIQTRTVLNIMSTYQNLISPLKLSVSLVYFSSPDNLIPNQAGNSGILFQQITTAKNAINILNTTNFVLGGSSDLQLGFQLASQNIENAFTQNNNLVLFFARGEYDKFSNCCPDPTADAANLRSLATVQGVLIGQYPNKLQMDLLTGSSSFDANSIIGNNNLSSTDTRQTIANQISNELVNIIDAYVDSQYCPSIPDYVNPPCEDPIDTLILLHADVKSNWNLIVNFTANQLIPDLLGVTGEPDNKKLTASYPINFAIASYYYLDVKIHSDFTFLRSPKEYMSLIQSIPFTATKGTATLSTAFKKAVDIFNEGRLYASKNVILITDTMDISDMENAASEHDALVQLVGGYTSALTINANTIPGADYQININPQEIDPSNGYTIRQLANSLTLHTCNYRPVQMPTNPTVPPSPTLPGPIPVVKARYVWPDVTILIDTSEAKNQNSTGMNAILFEKIRAFLDILLTQYSVGEKGSRFTIATFDGSTVEYSCKFIDTNNYYDLNSCWNERLSYYSRSHSNTRDIEGALADVLENVYGSENSGYRSLNENYLILMTLGKSDTLLQYSLPRIQRRGVRTISIGLSDVLTENEISAMAQTPYLVQNWDSIYTGIDRNYDLADRIIQFTTRYRTPSTSSFFANLVFIVDQSVTTANDHTNVVQFVDDFINPFLVDPLKTAISIVPFADSVISPLPLVTSQSSVDSYMYLWKTSIASDGSSNIGSAIQYVSDMLKTNNDRPTYVIFVIGANKTTGSASANNLPNSAYKYVANYNLVAQDYATQLAPNDTIFTVSSSNQLLNRVTSMEVSSPNPMVSLMNSIYSAQQNYDSQLFPISAIAADIIILLDETGLTDADFNTMKQFLSNFTALFDIGPQGTQFALQTYNGRTIPHDGFHLFESTSGDAVRTQINKLTLAKATENSTDADLAGAIEQELYFFLTEENGWRDDATTYTLIFSHADSFYKRDTNISEGVKNYSSVYAIGTNGMRFDYVRNFINTGFYETVDSVSTISLDSPAIIDLIVSMDNKYKNKVYPKQIPISSISQADFIFLVDNYLSNTYTQTIRDFLSYFVNNVAQFTSSGNFSRLAVVSYGNAGVESSWNFYSAQDVSSLLQDINNFNIVTSSGASNLQSAIDSIIMNENEFGINSNRPTYFTVIAGSPTISTDTIDSRTSRELNTRYSTFVIQTNSANNQYSYVPKVLGTKLTSGRVVYDSSLKLTDPQFATYFSWMANEYSAWATTFPDSFN